MGFWDRVGGVAGGLLDVGKGSVGFLLDTAESGGKLLTGDVDGADRDWETHYILLS